MRKSHKVSIFSQKNYYVRGGRKEVPLMIWVESRQKLIYSLNIYNTRLNEARHFLKIK